MLAFDEIRAGQNAPASRLMGEARGAFRQGKRDEGYAKAGEVVARFPASTSYRLAKLWVAERK